MAKVYLSIICKKIIIDESLVDKEIEKNINNDLDQKILNCQK